MSLYLFPLAIADRKRSLLDTHFMYIYLLISIDLQLSRSCNPSQCKAYSYNPITYVINRALVELVKAKIYNLKYLVTTKATSISS